MHNLQQFTELYALGMNPIPVIWDIEKRIVTKYPLHEIDVTDGKPHLQDVERWLNNGFKEFNGIALKLYPPFGMFDFDLKNTDNKGIYKEWFNIIANTNPDILDKICIETTRSGGYHVYIKYEKLSHKIPVARSNNGEEVISVYTGGLLSFCVPSPHYEIIHGDFASLGILSDDEFELLLSTAAFFNEDKEHEVGKSKVAVIDYPVEYENICLQFDNKCTDELFDSILNAIDLYKVDKKHYGRKKWVPYLREGSKAEYSAKAYFYSKRLLIFSASLTKFPTWHDSAKSGDNTWSLSPSKIIFYKNDKSWSHTIEEIQGICESVGIDLVTQLPVTEQPLISEERLKFPYDIFPDSIQNYIYHQTIQHEYLAGAILGSLSCAIGNTVVLKAVDGYMVKPILYMAIIAPAGASKTPAMKKAFSAIEEYDSVLYDNYLNENTLYKIELAKYKKDKNATNEPEKPPFPQTLIKDSTIEMVIKILSQNKAGCCVYADELSGFLNRMNQYKAGDEVQKWLELWSGSPVLLQRITRDENKVQEPYCSVIGGIQPGVLETLSKAENEHNGFFHRFLFVYPDPKLKNDWGDNKPTPDAVRYDFANLFAVLLSFRKSDKYIYTLENDANELYGAWFNHKNIKYNKATNDHVKGIIAKYQDYCLRFAILLQVIHDGMQRSNRVQFNNVERAIRLTEYFLGNMHKAIKILTPETPVDKLQKPYDMLYDALPNSFSIKTAQDIGEIHNMKPNSVKTFINRNISKLFAKIEHGIYEKMY